MKIKKLSETDSQSRHVGKYENKNPLHRFMLGRFFDCVAMEIAEIKPKHILDVGCGEALFWKEMEARGSNPENLTGIDLIENSFDMA